MYYILIKKADRGAKSLYEYYSEPEKIEIKDAEGEVTGYEEGDLKVYSTADKDEVAKKVDEILANYDSSSITVIRKMVVDYTIGITEEVDPPKPSEPTEATP